MVYLLDVNIKAVADDELVAWDSVRLGFIRHISIDHSPTISNCTMHAQQYTVYTYYCTSSGEVTRKAILLITQLQQCT